MTESKCTGTGSPRFFETVYIGYLWTTMIILLNVLIAIMNNRYEKAKRRAENTRRFRILSSIKALEKCDIFVKMIKKCKILDLWRAVDSTEKACCCYTGCCYGDKNHGSLIQNRELNRYYLLMLLPVDEKLEKP